MTSNEPELRIVYVERQQSAWAGFTPGRVFAAIAVIAIIAFGLYLYVDQKNANERAQQGIENAEHKQHQAERDLYDALTH